MSSIIDIVLHLDKHIQQWVSVFGPWIYAIIFLIILFETGVILTPFLPGDSLLFALGALTGGSWPSLHLIPVQLVLFAGAVLGGLLNYSIGAFIGPKIFQKEDSIWLRREHLIRTKEFYERHGGKAVVFARFIPIIRTFVPFVAGIGKMNYARYFMFNLSSAFGWVILVTIAGHFFGNIPVVKKNFGIVIPLIIVVSVLPLVWKAIVGRRSETQKSRDSLKENRGSK